jgi:hypothetical protein
MCIFDKQNGTLPIGCIPLNNLKKFFDMSKITTINPVLQRNGEKNSYALYNQRDTKSYESLS